MGLEIERKFLLKNENWRKMADQGTDIKQGYLSLQPERTVRVRVTDKQALLTIKGITTGMTRSEYEYEIPFTDAVELLELCEGAIIDKQRYIINYEGETWEIDIFKGRNEGLRVAEIELSNEEQEIKIPTWVGKEVTEDSRYYNVNLIENPYDRWD
ncbi:MAG: CYTH domain-containing protein [Saprospiraceae bacterium]|nr:CYTH domain-containing protein [Saprospiraceae bacterium]